MAVTLPIDESQLLAWCAREHASFKRDFIDGEHYLAITKPRRTIVMVIHRGTYHDALRLLLDQLREKYEAC